MIESDVVETTLGVNLAEERFVAELLVGENTLAVAVTTAQAGALDP